MKAIVCDKCHCVRNETKLYYRIVFFEQEGKCTNKDRSFEVCQNCAEELMASLAETSMPKEPR